MVQSIPGSTSYLVIDSGGTMWKNFLWIPIILIILFLFVPEEMILFVQGMIILGFAVSVCIGIIWVRQYYYQSLILKGQAHSALLQGRVIHNSQGTWIESDKRLELVPLHDNPALRINGHERPLTPDERWYRSLSKVIPGQATQIFNSSSTPLLPATTTLNLLEALDKESCILIYGPRGSGKTTLARQVILRRNHPVIVLDVKDKPDKWGGVKVIGQGGDFNAVSRSLESLDLELKRRLKDVSANHDKLLVAIDEWWIINQTDKELSRYLFSIVTLGREVNMDVLLICATKTVEGLGIKGDGELRQAFTIVHVQNINGSRQATIDYGDGEKEVYWGNDNTHPIPEVIIPQVQPSKEEQRIIDLKNEGLSLRKIALEVFGNTGGRQVNEVKYILDRWCVS